MTRQPRLLDANLRELERLLPLQMSATLDFEGTSSASITLAEDQRAIAMHDWIEVYTPAGSAGIFRVTNIDDTKRQERVLTLMHAIDTLSDGVWHGATDYDGTVAGFLAALLSQQSVPRWQLGACEDAGLYKRSGINYDKLSELLEEVREQEIGYYFDYDFTTTPWTLHFRAKPGAVTSEFRLSRNVESCRITRSDGEMCNRLFLSGNQKVDAHGVTKTETTFRTFDNTASQALYGVIEKTADIDLEDVPSADIWAANFLLHRGSPAVQISIDGYALRQITGETWDEAKLGQLSRVAMPDYGETLEERVVSIHYPELLFGEGVERLTVEMANHLPRFSESIAAAAKEAQKAGKAGRGAARGGAAAEELEQWAQVVVHHGDVLDETGVTELFESGIEMDAQTGVKIYSLAQGFVSQYAEIQVNRNAITAEVTRATGAEGTLSGRIDVQAGRISLLVEGEGASASIKLQAITDGINNAGSSVVINADKILLNGSTSIDALMTGRAAIASLWATSLLVGDLTIQTYGTLTLDDLALIMERKRVSWQQATVVTGVGLPSISESSERYFVYACNNDLTDLRTVRGTIITNYSGGSTPTTDTLYYLGRSSQ